MKILVTGSEGFIGKHLVEKLTVDGFDYLRIGYSLGIDITDWNVLKKYDKFDVLIHLAAKSYVPLSYKYPREFYNTNIIGTLNALELCRKNKAKLIYISSYVYGTPLYLPIDEKHPIKANNPYGQSKIVCENLCTGYYNNFDVPVTIIRPFNIFGPGQNDNFLIPSIINQAMHGNIVLKDPFPKRDFLYITDLINALVSIIRYKKEFEIFNLGSGISYSVREIANIVSELFSVEVLYTGEKRKDEIIETVANISKVKTLLNWEPSISLFEGIKSMIKVD